MNPELVHRLRVGSRRADHANAIVWAALMKEAADELERLYDMESELKALIGELE